MSLPLRSHVLAAMLFLAASIPVPAQLLKYTASENMIGVQGPVPEVFLSFEEWVYLTFVFDPAMPPVAQSATSATYAGLYGIAELGSGGVYLLFDVTLRITRDPTVFSGDYHYMFSGVSADGWTFTHFAYGEDPAFVPNLNLPTTTPPGWPDFYAAGYVDVIGPDEAWHAYSDAGGWFLAGLAPVEPDAPSITAQPRSESVRPGKTAKFDVSASSAFPLSYQWLKDGLPLPGQTARKLKIKNATTADGGIYRVVLWNEAGVVVSEAAELTLE
ncbi:MAG TPA: immunoglobulin domain-containing protein [Opitutaceae bacterium]